ncbi:DUF2489 domain-containing protein [Ferrimonas balearica]|uniref:DUF2489 domain-containing protein n=1 Tax=Ferrimonas balearica TaxID=44012 RepID=UPI001C5BB169|nr:DUF2489 domain-containing protein [Ferrimonas balearica]MBY6019518.1 DUF2489 domain-containing protein [Halomonas denitrificans]MBW3166462.1 DUF2489 domain-containing protein [Ferrimonas balearica]MBY6096583.1 DUF2489 domain-containing protein [Ferrimonas balearica]MBY6108416.1 DUF2489 domain-containing protein [Ferrimonas balearica]MBY6226039.1 DUF2489 domain-containing protein [Ferrimonas balearica]
MPTWMVAVATGIIIALAGYAAALLWQLRQQRQRQARLKTERRATLAEQIQLIAKACLEKQCEPSEGALRLVNLLRALPDSDMDALRQQYPVLHELFDKVADHPILDARKALKRNERMKLDMERAHWEARLGPKLDPELTQLAALQ